MLLTVLSVDGAEAQSTPIASPMRPCAAPATPAQPLAIGAEAGRSGKSRYEAIEAGTDKLEDEARRRGVEGVDKPVIYKGEITDNYREYSDTLLMFLLNGRRPERFRQRASVEHAGKGGEAIELVTLDAIDAGDRKAVKALRRQRLLARKQRGG